MEAVTLRSRIGRYERLGYLLFTVVFAYALFAAIMRMRILEIIVVCLSGILLGFGWHSGRNRSQIRIDSTGLIIAAFYAATLRVSWSEIEAFGIATLSTMEDGVRQSTGKQYVGIRLTNSSVLKDTKQCSESRRLSDYDILLSASYGMPVKEFEAFLIDAKKSAANA